MTNWAALDVAIGLVLVYFVLSLVASTLNETIASVLGWRAKYLERWLINVVCDPTTPAVAKEAVDEFYGHPLVRPLIAQPRGLRTRKTRARRPSYIPTELFSAVVFNFDRAAVAGRRVDEIMAALPEGELRRALSALRQEVGDDLEELRARLERWYDNAMERVSGWYKRRVQLVLAIIGLVVVIALNADTLSIVQTLWADKTVRAAVVAEAGIPRSNTTSNLKGVADEVKGIKALNVPLGWKLRAGDPRDLPHSSRLWAGKVIGILLTTLALMLGAPFWFDLLSKIVRVRGSGAPPPARDAIRSGEGEQRRAGVGATL
jgi:hypothetical protein